jgi:hypothetical protein
VNFKNRRKILTWNGHADFPALFRVATNSGTCRILWFLKSAGLGLSQTNPNQSAGSWKCRKNRGILEVPKKPRDYGSANQRVLEMWNEPTNNFWERH